MIRLIISIVLLVMLTCYGYAHAKDHTGHLSVLSNGQVIDTKCKDPETPEETAEREKREEIQSKVAAEAFTRHEYIRRGRYYGR